MGGLQKQNKDSQSVTFCNFVCLGSLGQMKQDIVRTEGYDKLLIS